MPIFLHKHIQQKGWQMTSLILCYASVHFKEKRNDVLWKPSQLVWGDPMGNESQGCTWLYAHKTAVCMEGCSEYISHPPPTSAFPFLSPFCADRPRHEPVQ